MCGDRVLHRTRFNNRFTCSISNPMNQTDHIKSYLYASLQPLMMMLKDEAEIDMISAAARIIGDSLINDNKIVCIGNGGSMADAQHFAAELTGKYRFPREPYAAVVPDSSYLTAVGNDFGYNEVFERFVKGVGRPGDTLIALTTSGKSENVMRAVSYAINNGLSVVLITGDASRHGGSLHPNSELCHIRIPSSITSHVQELTMTLLHVIVELIEARLNP